MAVYLTTGLKHPFDSSSGLFLNDGLSAPSTFRASIDHKVMLFRGKIKCFIALQQNFNV